MIGTSIVSRTSSPNVDSSAAVTTPANLRVSAYDRVASLLVALLVIVGFLVFTLFLLWWAKRAIAANRPVEIKAIEEFGGRDEPIAGIGRELDEPGVEELAEVEQPQLADTLAAVTTAVTLQPATIDDLLGDADNVGQGRGLGDRSTLGESGDGSKNIIPRWERWEIRFSAQPNRDLR